MKKIYVVKPSLPPIEEYVKEISDIWETGIMTHQGPKHNRLVEELKTFMDVDNLTLFANGHLALELGLESFGFQGEVITTPFTFASTTQAILRNGLKPVFCDINLDDYTIDCDKIEELITEKTVAIVPVHVYGNLCDVERIHAIAKKHNLKVIYDGAHAFGVKYKGVDVSHFGDAVMFSFHATKVLNTVEGGCLVYQDEEKKQLLEGYRQFGQIVGTDVTPYIGTNAKMTDIHAAMGLCNLRHFDEYISKRKSIVKRYRERLGGIEGIKICKEQENVTSNYAYFSVVFEEEKTGISRDMAVNALAENNIVVRKYFYPLCSDFEIVRGLGIDASVPVAKYISDRVITVPCYSDLELEDVDRICDTIISLYEGV